MLRHFVRYWLPVILWMGIIFVFSEKRRVTVADTYILNFIFFKTLHLAEYAVLYVISYRALFNSANQTISKSAYFLAFAVTVWYAALDEIHQLLVPTREGRLRDVIIDGIGAGLAWIYLARLLPIAPRKLRLLAEKWQLI